MPDNDNLIIKFSMFLEKKEGNIKDYSYFCIKDEKMNPCCTFSRFEANVLNE